MIHSTPNSANPALWDLVFETLAWAHDACHPRSPTRRTVVSRPTMIPMANGAMSPTPQERYHWPPSRASPR